MTTANQRTEAVLLGGIAALAAPILVVFWPFTADDAYIYMRYGENLVDTGALVFNQGERVSTMTSPLLALLNAALYALTGATRMSYKVVSLGFLVATVVIVLRHQPRDPWLRALAAGVVATSPPVLLWTVGGMETPLLMLVVTAATSLALDCDRSRPGRATAVLLLAGVATVCRQDAVPYMAGLSAFALWGQRPRALLTAIAAGAVVPVSWSLWSLLYYEDLFPTSVYVKPPMVGAAWLASNALYVAQGLLDTGALALLGSLLLASRLRRPDGDATSHARPFWGLWLGLALQLAYTLTMATVHMMFAFRAVVPYLPALVLLAGEAARRRSVAPRPGRETRGLAAALVMLMALQALQAARTYQTSVQGFALTGEFQRVSTRELIAAMPVVDRLIREVRAHWLHAGSRNRREHPRIWTGWEGLMAHTYRDAYFFGPLTSYRHHARVDLSWADYIIVTPPDMFAAGPGIASFPIEFEGRSFLLKAIYNPDPTPGVLPETVADPPAPP